MAAQRPKAQDSTAQDASSHRPLPSVGMPLLRDERRASRWRSFVGAAGIVIVLTLLLAAKLWWRGEDGTAPDPTPERQAASLVRHQATAGASGQTTLTSTSAKPHLEAEGNAELPPAARVTQHRFGRARTFREALRGLGLSKEDTAAVEGALAKVFDFRRCRPQDKLALGYDVGGALRYFRYDGDPRLYYVAQRGKDGSWSGREVRVPVRVREVARAGRVEASLGDALLRAGYRHALVGMLVSMFAGRVHFASQARKGDTFRLIVSEEHLAGHFHRYRRVESVEYRGAQVGTLRAYWFAPKGGRGRYYNDEGRALHGSWLETPLRYDRITSRFDPHRRHPILKRVVPHNGVDFAAAIGTPVWAAAHGRVRFAGKRGANGNLVVIDHQGGYQSAYAHLSRIAGGIRAGTRVKARQVIGAVGNTGRSTGPHLHFGLKRGSRFVDPLTVLHRPGPLLPVAHRARFSRLRRRRLRQMRALKVRQSTTVAHVTRKPSDER
ncbi:MAG: M23 family metallopeptidase [Polyangiales bacterium]